MARPSLFNLHGGEQADVWRLVALVRGKMLTELRPDGFNADRPRLPELSI
jgi:hypothetical protein